jgi:acyl-CoA reductase-like NAD-dependent aldehyde dehydrogenase
MVLLYGYEGNRQLGRPQQTSTPKPAVTEAKAFIGGAWRSGEGREVLQSPIDGSESTIVHLSSGDDVAEAARTSAEAWQTWQVTPAHERARLLDRLAALVDGHATDLANQIVIETGKLARESRTEVQQSVDILRVCAEEASRLAGDGVPMDAVAAGDGKLGFTMRVPLGVIAGITPFNVPISAACHKLGPALAAGNTFILKPHQNGSGAATLLAALVQEAGFPDGVFGLVQGGAEVGRALVTQASVRLITLTGGGQAARHIVAAAGLKQTLFELGGIGPTIVHKDADLDAAVRDAVTAAFALNGQSCVSTQRILVHETVKSEFVNALVKCSQALRPGNPFDEASGVGPMISLDAARRIVAWVAEAVDGGGGLGCGGSREGAYVEPTVLVDPPADSRVLCEEVFGPVVSVTPYADLKEAISIANSTQFGLKAGIFTSSLSVALQAVRGLQFGGVNVNGPSRFRVLHEPYGGVKESGWGREGPRFAMEAMTALKMVSIASTNSTEP